MISVKGSLPHHIMGRGQTIAHVDGVRSPASILPPAHLALGHRLLAGSGYDATARTVELIAATETAVLMPGYMVGLYDIEHYYEVLDCSPDAVDLSQVVAGNVPVLDTHDRWSLSKRLGVIRSARVENDQVVTLYAFGQSAEARDVEKEFAGGTPPKVSAGYRRGMMILAGMHEDIPIYRVTSWMLAEVSLVSIAADPNAGVRTPTLLNSSTTTETIMTLPNTGAAAPGILATPLASEATRSFPEIIGVRGPAASPPNAGGAQTAPTATPTPTPAPAPTPTPAPAPTPTPAPTPAPAPAPAPTDAANGTDGTRAAHVQRFTVSGALDLLEVARSFGGEIVTRAQEVIDQNERGEIGIDAARAAVLQAARDAQRTATGGLSTGGRGIEITHDEREKFRTGARNSIIQRAGLTQLVLDGARARGQDAPDLDPGEYAGIHNDALARIALEKVGQRVSSYDRDEVIGQAMGIRTGPMQSTSDFPVIFDSVVNVAVQASYAVTPDTWSEFCATGSVNDFRPTYNLLTGTLTGGLDRVLENGEIKNKALPDGAREAIQAKPYGNLIALTREMLVNDNLGVFTDTAVELGRLGKESIERDVYALLAMNGGRGPIMSDGLTLFHPDHGNIVTPAGDLTNAQVEAMDNLFAQQTDLSGQTLDIKLAIHLVPYVLGRDARAVNDNANQIDSTGKLLIPNRVQGLFEKIVASKRLKGKARYGFAGARVAPTLKVVFLNGNQEPKVETKDGWRTSGTEWRVLFDYGVGAINYRGAIMDPGA